MDDGQNQLSTSRTTAGLATILLVFGAALYLYGWSIDTTIPTDNENDIARLEAQTAAIRIITANIQKQIAILWWADRLVLAGLALAIISAILHRSEK